MLLPADISSLNTKTPREAILTSILEHEPIRKHELPDRMSASFSRNQVFDEVAKLAKDGYIEMGDVEDGFLLMLTISGREEAKNISRDSEPQSHNISNGSSPVSLVSEKKKSFMKRLIEFLSDHPGCTRADLRMNFSSETGALSVALVEGKKNGRLSFEIDEAQIERISTGPNDHATAAEMTKLGASKNNSAPSKPRSSSIPVVLPKSAGASSSAPAKAETPDPAPPEAKLPPKRFRVARTSDRTLILFGLTPDSLELDPESTKILCDFIVDEF